MNKTIEKLKQEVARPLKMLVPLIKQDLRDAEDAAKQAAMPYYVAAGEKLMEARSQLDAIAWGMWLTKNFHLSQASARDYMTAAKRSGAIEFETLSQAHGDKRPHHEAPWSNEVKTSLRGFRAEQFNLRQHDLSEAKEERLERQLAMQLIDIGYKVLAVKLHPDKGGSSQAMQRLNRVRNRLKEAV